MQHIQGHSVVPVQLQVLSCQPQETTTVNPPPATHPFQPAYIPFETPWVSERHLVLGQHSKAKSCVGSRAHRSGPMVRYRIKLMYSSTVTINRTITQLRPATSLEAKLYTSEALIARMPTAMVHPTAVVIQ